MRDPWEEAELARVFATHARTALPRAPLNAALASVIARDRSLSSLLAHAPPSQRQPVLLLAALHLLARREPTARFAQWYPTVTDDPRAPDDPTLGAALRTFVADRTAEIIGIVADRQVQTNEVGRCALLLPVFAAIAAETDRPLAHVDVGSSAGLTLMIDRLGYRYTPDGDAVPGPLIGAPDVIVECGLRGRLQVPLPSGLPRIAAAIGLDPRPVDLGDDDAIHWLLACCWPDEIERFERLQRAIELARRHRPQVEVGTAGTASDHIGSVDRTLHPVVTTTWVMNYLEPTERRAFVHDLAALGGETDLDWVFAESPAKTPELPHPAELAGEHITALVQVSWRDGRRRVRHVARAHPHGHWMHALARA